MAALTWNTTASNRPVRQLEDLALTNVAADATYQKAVPVPEWAHSAHFVVQINSMGGTTPTVDFKLQGVNPLTVDDASVWDLGGWDGITQVTSAAAVVAVAVDVGAEIAADDVGAADASCRYGVNASLPSVIVYRLFLGGGDADEDYNIDLFVTFRR